MNSLLVPRTDFYETQSTTITGGCLCQPPRTCMLCDKSEFRVHRWVRRPLFAQYALAEGTTEDEDNRILQQYRIGKYTYIFARDMFSEMLQIWSIPSLKYPAASFNQMKHDMTMCGSWNYVEINDQKLNSRHEKLSPAKTSDKLSGDEPNR